MGEAICKAYFDQGINVKVIRLALGYGEGFRSDDVRVLYEFIRSACNTNKIKLRDAGKAPRTYIHTADVATIIANIISGSLFLYIMLEKEGLQFINLRTLLQTLLQHHYA